MIPERRPQGPGAVRSSSLSDEEAERLAGALRALTPAGSGASGGTAERKLRAVDDLPDAPGDPRS
jgi:hypothetical protein